ncbi:MAG TPA: TIR domain-containing protein [Allosphingosinicella sp.]|nr:TIR domain-containing protein [Allosphingosinicella sp.]
MSESTGPVVFISHHSSQAALARALKAKLAAAGITGWMAPDDIDPGVSFDQAIIAQVARSDGIVLLFCGNSDQSRHVKRELILGEDSGRPIYPVRLENVMPKGLAYWLQDYQWIDWLGGKGGGADRLIETIRRNAAGGGPDGAADATTTGDGGHPPPATGNGRRRRALVIAGGVALLLALAAGAWFFLLRPAATPAADDAAYVLNPGKWIARRDVTAITYPEMDVAQQREIERSVEYDPDPEECIAPEVARAPGVELFDPGGEGGCRLSRFVMANGRMSGYINCPLRDAPGGEGLMTVAFEGTYTRTLIEMNKEITVSLPNRMLRMRARDTTRYVGPTCSPRTPQATPAPAPAGNGQ